jgi:hypothetical protein
LSAGASNFVSDYALALFGLIVSFRYHQPRNELRSDAFCCVWAHLQCDALRYL